ncbi:MAG: alpha/beta fold hydrolase [Acidobacteriota bacterium]
MNTTSQATLMPFTREQADEQYNPTLWTRRLPSDELLPAHVQFTTGHSDAYRQEIGDGLSCLSFGEGELAGEMDLYHPASLPENAPVVVYVHGGWWQWFSKEAFGYIAKPFNEQGYSVVLPGYRMAPDWKSEAPMESLVAQVQHAVAAILVRAHESGAPAVHLLGHSAGGHLVTLLHRTDWSELGVSEEAQGKLKSVTSLAGLFDLRPLVDTYVNDEIGMSMEAAERVSPLLMSVPGDERCPLHLVLPEHDTPEFFRQTKEYQEKLLRAGQECHLHVSRDRDHLDMIERLSDGEDELLGYLLESMARAEVVATSREWIASFNSGDVAACARGYAEGARMHAKPVGSFEGREAIESFWRQFTSETGATDLRYADVQLTASSPTEVLLSASWSMNVGRGIITKELWVRQDDGAWRLEEDHFEVQEQF